jgi:hypothetical protein
MGQLRLRNYNVRLCGQKFEDKLLGGRLYVRSIQVGEVRSKDLPEVCLSRTTEGSPGFMSSKRRAV